MYFKKSLKVGLKWLAGAQQRVNTKFTGKQMKTADETVLGGGAPTNAFTRKHTLLITEDNCH